ncbi:hypothetical protein [Nocardia brasiliensis]|uniref:hypothetical protein n=1 Tax=Nocardia brasiliensis TaxID=37326 RepID=UPI0018941270|nr:hypothetical protein [Nocardia brasiliensis]MBF6125789.1 hypothetical protein [Nocardia brasiliensis]MBF6543203.1 hypothetical protein [Nocardia brasiliensis]
MKTPALGGVVFDTAAVVSWANQANYAQAVVWATVGANNTIVVPATALAAARAHIPPHRLDILDVLLELPHTIITALDRGASERLGAAFAGNPDAELLLPAGHAAAEAVARDWPCLTARPRKLRQLDPRVIIDLLP